MKSRKFLALFLAIFMLASLVIPVSAITPDAVEGIVGYSADLVETVDTTNLPSITTIPCSKKIIEGELVTNEEFVKGSNPTGSYTISSVLEFLYFDQLISDYKYSKSDWYGSLDGVTIYLTTDLDFDGATITPVGEYEASGSEYRANGFSGVFDGQGHTIDDVKIVPEKTASTKQLNRAFYGLFACLAPKHNVPCGIKNLTVGANVVFDLTNVTHGHSSSAKHIGGVVGTVYSGTGDTDANQRGIASFTNVCNKANGVTGGIVAHTKACHVTFTNCTNEGALGLVDEKTCKINSALHMGGILGCAGENGNDKFYDMSLEFTNCINKGDFEVKNAGANAQYLKFGSMVGAVAGSGNYDGASDYTGSSKGSLHTASFTNCMNEGDVLNNGVKQDTAVSVYGEHLKSGEYHWKIATPVNYQDRPAANNFTDKMNVKYYQMSTTTYKNSADKDCYSLRLISLHSAIDSYTDYGYDIEITYVDPTSKESVTVSTSVENLKTVNTSIKVATLDQTNLDANVTEVKAADLDANYQYISAVCIDNIPVAYGNLTVTVTPKLDNGTVTGTPITFVVTPNYAN